MKGVKRHKSNYVSKSEGHITLTAANSINSQASSNTVYETEIKDIMNLENKQKMPTFTEYDYSTQPSRLTERDRFTQTAYSKTIQKLPTIIQNRIKGGHVAKSSRKMTNIYKLGKPINKFSPKSSNLKMYNVHYKNHTMKFKPKQKITSGIQILKSPNRISNKTINESFINSGSLVSLKSMMLSPTATSPVSNQVANIYVPCYRSGYSPAQRLLGKKRADLQYYKVVNAS